MVEQKLTEILASSMPTAASIKLMTGDAVNNASVGELPEALKLRISKTYGDSIAAIFNPDELEVASAVACFDMLHDKNEFTDE